MPKTIGSIQIYMEARTLGSSDDFPRAIVKFIHSRKGLLTTIQENVRRTIAARLWSHRTVKHHTSIRNFVFLRETCAKSCSGSQAI
jgi:hypothetical protein